jgi:hypothetical protein
MNVVIHFCVSTIGEIDQSVNEWWRPRKGGLLCLALGKLQHLSFDEINEGSSKHRIQQRMKKESDDCNENPSIETAKRRGRHNNDIPIQSPPWGIG